jgi:hypothetical protein
MAAYKGTTRPTVNCTQNTLALALRIVLVLGREW